MAGLRWSEEQLAQVQAGFARPVEPAAPASVVLPKSHSTAVPVVVDGIRFPSKAEGAYFTWLRWRQSVGDVRYFLRQVPFHLPGPTTYRVDFMVVDDAGVHYVDVKGRVLDAFKRNKKQVEALYPVTLECVRWKRGWFHRAQWETLC